MTFVPLKKQKHNQLFSEQIQAASVDVHLKTQTAKIRQVCSNPQTKSSPYDSWPHSEVDRGYKKFIDTA